ncbi:MAG: TSUP family transporter [Bacteroidota bacterium]|nr:TSUP family transporter [Bacteroidota bacterium]
MRLLIVGGGNIGLEKLTTVLHNSPATKIKLVSITISDDIKQLAAQHQNIELHERAFEEGDLSAADIVITALNDHKASEEICLLAKQHGKLINAADKPDLCDFYLSSVVKKGSLKIAISTNGKSPTIAKRLKEVIKDMLPDEMESVLDNMQTIRNGMNGDFNEKVKQLNDLTKMLVAKQAVLEVVKKPAEKQWQKVVKWCLFAFLFMIIGHTVLSYVPYGRIVEGIRAIPNYVDTRSFFIMLFTGFLAQMTDGSLGMGYGTISTTFLLANGVPPAIVSSRVHSARVFSSGVSGYSHHRFGNINKKLFRALVIPGVIGAVIGAALAFLGQKYSSYVRIPLSIYTLYLGYYIVRKAFGKRAFNDKVRQAGWLASAGGFMDAFAGGGWGTLVTSTLIAKRRSARYVIGSVCLAEFFVVLASSITFFILLKSVPLLDVLGLIIGGLIAAPIAARLVGKLPLKTMFIIVGCFVILTSLNTLYKASKQVMQPEAKVESKH